MHSINGHRLAAYNDRMKNRPFSSSSEKTGYTLDRGRRNFGAGAAIGVTLGALTFFLFSKWLPEHFFLPTVLISGALFGFVFGIVWPVELEYHEFGDDPDNISPAERVDRLKVRGDTRQG